MSRPRIVITQQAFEETRKALSVAFDVDVNDAGHPWSGDELRQRLHDADGVMAFMPDRFGSDLLARCRRLKVVAAALKGYDNFDVAAFREHEVALSVAGDLLTIPTAELAVGLTIALARNVLAGDRVVRSGGFQGWRPQLYGNGLDGATVGLVGFGKIGKAIHDRLVPFGCVLQYHDPVSRDDRAPNISLEHLLSTSDYLFLCAPLNDATRSVIDATAIKKMRSTASIVNLSRGSLVDEGDIATALESGQLAGYASDVFAFEDWAEANRPMNVDERLLRSDKTVFTPHLGSAVVNTRLLIELEAAQALLDFFEGKEPKGLVIAGKRA